MTKPSFDFDTFYQRLPANERVAFLKSAREFVHANRPKPRTSPPALQVLDAEHGLIVSRTATSVRFQVGDRTIAYSQPRHVDGDEGDRVLISGEVVQGSTGGYYLRAASFVTETRTGLEGLRAH